MNFFFVFVLLQLQWQKCRCVDQSMNWSRKRENFLWTTINIGRASAGKCFLNKWTNGRLQNVNYLSIAVSITITRQRHRSSHRGKGIETLSTFDVLVYPILNKKFPFLQPNTRIVRTTYSNCCSLSNTISVYFSHFAIKTYKLFRTCKQLN